MESRVPSTDNRIAEKLYDKRLTIRMLVIHDFNAAKIRLCNGIVWSK